MPCIKNTRGRKPALNIDNITMEPRKPLLNFLIACFWASIALITIQITFAIILIYSFPHGVHFESGYLIRVLLFILSILWLFLTGYAVYFYFSYDKYSSSGIFFLFFHMAYALIYFYRIIWKRKRPLAGTINTEPLLGNSILLENEDSEITAEEQKEHWRQLWLESIYELTSIDLQRDRWLDKNNNNPHYTFIEFNACYFDDLLSDMEYQHYIEVGWVSSNEYEIIKEWHKELDDYQPPENDHYNHSAILQDLKWINIVEKGRQARIQLIEIVTEKEMSYLRDYPDLIK